MRVSSLMAATALGGSMVLACGQAYAQVAPTPVRTAPQQTQPTDEVTEIDEVIVIGTRAALEAGLRTKRDAVQFVESVVAEDIGKLPDQNVAESLQRVPGVQVTQGIGEGTSVTIRGSRDNLYLLNGRNLIDVAGRGGTGLDTLGTSTYGVLSVIPAELISRLDVTKLPGADEIEGALGGTVNIRTRRPLDQRGNLLSGSVEWNYRELGGTSGGRSSVLASTSNSDGTLGALINVVYSQVDVHQDSFSSFAGYTNVSDSFNNNTRLFPGGRPNPLARFRIADLRYQTLSDRRDRLGATVTLQWKPSDLFNVYLDSTYATTDSDRERNWLAVPVSNSAPDYRTITISPDGYIVGGQIGPTPPATTLTVRPTLNREFALIESTLSSTALGATWNNGRLSVFGEISYTDADSQLHQVATVLTPAAPTPYSFAYQGAGQIPTVDLSSAGLTDPSLLVWQGLQDNRRHSQTTSTGYRLDADYDVNFGAITTVEFGARYEDLSYLLTPRNVSLSSTVGQPSTGFNMRASVTPNLIEQFDGQGFLPGANFPRTFTTASRAVLNEGCAALLAYYTAGQRAACESTTPTFEQISGVDEKTFAVYAKVNFETDIGLANLRGNFGARYVEDDRVGRGFILFNNFVPTVPGGTAGAYVREFTANEVEFQDSYFLPSAVVRVKLPNDLVVRAGAARVIARPATSLLNAGFTVTEPSTPSGVFSASGGNARLEPYLVDQYDAAVEWYFAEGGLLSAAAFYKDVKTYFVRQARPEVLPGYNNDEPINVSRTLNFADATVQGLEFIYQQRYSFLPGFLDGLGSQFSFSYIDSETPTIDPVTGDNLPLPGLSKYSYNAVVYYETSKFGMRVGYNWRDQYFESIGSNSAGIYYDNFASLTGSFRYSFTSRTRLTISASNLNAEPLIRFNATPDYIQSYEENGTTFNVSLSSRF